MGVSMRKRAAVYIGALWLSSAIILTATAPSAAAWQGRAFHVTGPALARATPPCGAGRGEYRLVFPAGYDMPARPKGAGSDPGRESKFENFVARLSEAGSEGYRLVSFVYRGSGLPVGLVRMAGAAYEYRWLYTDARTGGAQVTVDFDKTYPALAEQGFRLAEYSEFENGCDYFPGSVSPEPGPYYQECNYAYVFLLEREKGVARAARYSVASSSGGTDAAFVAEVRRMLADGLLPTHALPAYALWFEPAGTGGGPLRDWADIEVVRAGAGWRSTFRKRVNELARHGYRAALIDWGLALMYRPRGASAARSYVWVETDDGLEERLAQLQAKGAAYLKTYKQDDKLVFEQGAVSDGERYEYKALRFKFSRAEGASKSHVRVELTSSSEERWAALDRLVGEGFAVRDLFFSGGQVGVVLARRL